MELLAALIVAASLGCIGADSAKISHSKCSASESKDQKCRDDELKLIFPPIDDISNDEAFSKTENGKTSVEVQTATKEDTTRALVALEENGNLDMKSENSRDILQYYPEWQSSGYKDSDAWEYPEDVLEEESSGSGEIETVRSYVIGGILLNEAMAEYFIEEISVCKFRQEFENIP